MAPWRSCTEKERKRDLRDQEKKTGGTQEKQRSTQWSGTACWRWLLLAGDAGTAAQKELGARAREAADVVARQEEKGAAAIGRR